MAHIQQPNNNHNAEASSENVTVKSPYMTKQEIADYFRCSTKTIERKAKSGQIKEFRENGFILYPKKENHVKE